MDGALQEETVISRIKNLVDTALKEYGRTAETKLGPYSAQILVGGLLNPMEGILQSVGACVGAAAASVVVDAVED